MSSEVLADQAVSLLRKLFTNDLPNEAERATTAVAELVEDGLTEAAQENRLREFHTNPTDEEAHDDLANALEVRLNLDRFYRDAVAREVDKALRAVKTARPTADPATRDANGNVVHDVTTGAAVRSGAASAVLWLVSTAVTVGLAFGGFQVYRAFTDWANAGFMGEDTKCSEFVASHRAFQQEVLKQLYAEAGEYDRAGDPFISLEVAAACGRSPDTTLGTIVARTP